MGHAKDRQKRRNAIPIEPEPIVLRQLTKKERIAKEKKRILEAISRTETPSSAVIIEAYSERAHENEGKGVHAFESSRLVREDIEKLRAIAWLWDQERGIKIRNH